MTRLLILCFLIILNGSLLLTEKCIERNYGNGGTVCVCNATYCDTTEVETTVENGHYKVYTSNEDGYRLHSFSGKFKQKCNSANVSITIDANQKYQSIIGWGGAFTDSAGINIMSLSEDAQNNLMEAYFTDGGLGYTLCRVPMAGTDFSTHAYTYDDFDGDVNLSMFNLTAEDYDYKIPLMQQALNLKNGELQFFATPWTAPPWMKTKFSYDGGILQPKYYQVWANYYKKFFEAYQKQNISFWGLTTGNEPANAFIHFEKINAMGWFPNTQSKWIKDNLGPTLRNSTFKDIKIMMLDDQRLYLPWIPAMELADNITRSYVDGIAVHWYTDDIVPVDALDETHELFPNIFILNTESCAGSSVVIHKKPVILGSWSRGEDYAKDIIDDLNHWVTGWIDWNLALDEIGGPSYIENFVDSAIIVNATGEEFYKQPIYYALAHFTKFIPVDSQRISAVADSKNIQVTAFTRPDNGTSVVVFNGNDEDITVCITDNKSGSFSLNVTRHSINTIVY